MVENSLNKKVDSAKAQAKKKSIAGKVTLRFFTLLFAIILAVVIFLFGIITVICKGPSESMKNLFVTTVMETSAAKFLAHIYFSDSEIETIIQKNAVAVVEEVTTSIEGFEESEDDVPKDTIEIKDVSGPTFKGKMMIIHDPSRVKVAAAPDFSGEASGLRVEEFVENAGAVAGINGGGFADENGVGKGGLPLGIVISDGKFLFGNLETKSPIVGFDKNDRLVVGTLTGQECIDRGIRDAVTFGPTFIVNGKAASVSGTGGGLNPRSVLGQRADGAVLMLAIDGRQAHSMGASYKDCIDVMLEFGAVNAGNLDGGSSTIMVHNGEFVNICASLYGSRQLPNAFIVK